MALWMVVGLWLVYLALTANLELGNVVLGLLVAVGLTLLLRPPRGAFELRRLPEALVAAISSLELSTGSALARPKSTNQTRPSSPSRILAGLMSRCRIGSRPLVCM